jgi:hypothetical protein
MDLFVMDTCPHDCTKIKYCGPIRPVDMKKMYHITEMLPKEWFDQEEISVLTETSFEGIVVPCPTNPKAWLRRVYGSDWKSRLVYDSHTDFMHETFVWPAMAIDKHHPFLTDIFKIMKWDATDDTNEPISNDLSLMIENITGEILLKPHEVSIKDFNKTRNDIMNWIQLYLAR